MKRYFEDILVGERASFGHYKVTRDEVLEFARKFDPQRFHVSDEAAGETHFGRLAASGWHSCAMTMAMMVAHWEAEGLETLGGVGVDDLRWLKPVHPGDTLRCEAEVVETRLSRSRPMGSVRTATTVFNQNQEPVLRFESTGLFPTRPA